MTMTSQSWQDSSLNWRGIHVGLVVQNRAARDRRRRRRRPADDANTDRAGVVHIQKRGQPSVYMLGKGRHIWHEWAHSDEAGGRGAAGSDYHRTGILFLLFRLHFELTDVDLYKFLYKFLLVNSGRMEFFMSEERKNVRNCPLARVKRNYCERTLRANLAWRPGLASVSVGWTSLYILEIHSKGSTKRPGRK